MALAAAALVPADRAARSVSAHGAILVVADPGVPSSRREQVVRSLTVLWPQVRGDFPATPNSKFTVHLYATHAAFGRALHREEGIWPESSRDDMGNVSHGVLPLGPTLQYLNHRLAHVLTEWLLDRLTGNRQDLQPTPAWLYDGIAEWEAGRRAGRSPCSLHGEFPVPLRSVASPAHWMRVRGGPLGSLEYCEAGVAASRLIGRRGGWNLVRAELARHPGWKVFAAWLGSAP